MRWTQWLDRIPVFKELILRKGKHSIPQGVLQATLGLWSACRRVLWSNTFGEGCVQFLLLQIDNLYSHGKASKLCSTQLSSDVLGHRILYAPHNPHWHWSALVFLQGPLGGAALERWHVCKRSFFLGIQENLMEKPETTQNSIQNAAIPYSLNLPYFSL